MTPVNHDIVNGTAILGSWDLRSRSMDSSDISSPARNRVRCRQFSAHCVFIQSRTPEGTVPLPTFEVVSLLRQISLETLLGVSLRSLLTVKSAITHPPKDQGGRGIIYMIAIRNPEGNHTGSGVKGYLQANQSLPAPPPSESACLGSDGFLKSSRVPNGLHEPSPGSPCSTPTCFCC